MICSWKPERLTDGERHGIGKAWEELISKPPSNVPTYLSANTLDHDAQACLGVIQWQLHYAYLLPRPPISQMSNVKCPHLTFCQYYWPRCSQACLGVIQWQLHDAPYLLPRPPMSQSLLGGRRGRRWRCDAPHANQKPVNCPNLWTLSQKWWYCDTETLRAKSLWFKEVIIKSKQDGETSSWRLQCFCSRWDSVISILALMLDLLLVRFKKYWQLQISILMLISELL